MRGVVNNITMTYSVEELKTILGIDDKYTGGSFQNFKVNVLDRIIDEINENCPTMFVKYSYLKTHRKVTGIVFSVYERKESPELLEQAPPIKENKAKTDVKTYTPNEQELEALTRAKGHAFKILVDFGIFPGIAYKQIIPKIKGSEFDGYEDFFVEKAILHFEKNAIQKTTKELKASTFVTWWTKNKVFESGDVWADISEKLSKHKKQLQTTNPAAFENRLIAKTMTNAEFEVYINKTR
jgi:Initiator Replication protein